LKLIPKYIDEILNLIKHFPSVTIQLTALKILIDNMDDNLIDSNHSVLQEMIEMGFKETELSVFRSWELLSLVTILNKTSMMRNYSSRLKSLISNIITAMELDDEDEWDMKSFCKLVSAVKQTSFMDHFLPQLEQLFSKLLKEFEKEPWLLESEEFDYFAIADTKLLEKLKEWERKWMKI